MEVSKRKCQDRSQVESDRAGIRILAEMFGRFEMRDWGLNEDQFQLALASLVFRGLVKPVPGQKPGQERVNVTDLWKAANEPVDKTPLEWISRSWKPEDQVIEDRGADGVWTDFETAAWYTLDLDDRIEISDIIDMCC